MSALSTLLLRLEGPMQSWGYRSRFKIRDTGLEPTKSGIVGLLYCALGRDRAQSPADLAKLKMHVRVDRQGQLLTDFHTAGGGTFRGQPKYYAPTSSGGKGTNPVITERQYLVDASFVIALEGEAQLVAQLAESVQDPVWPLNLGRKSCAPSTPVFVARTDELRLGAFGEVPPPQKEKRTARPRYLWEVDEPGSQTETRHDVPVAWPDRFVRQYAIRFVQPELGAWPE